MKQDADSLASFPKAAQATLRGICEQARLAQRIARNFKVGARSIGRTGLRVLFLDSGGIEKNLAAQFIASELQLSLMRIDLAALVSKYIGETEKNLERVFAEAQAKGAVLFFDEADALFGKRTDVRDAHDRYANLEVSYLLQRIEEYAGVVILTSNHRHNIDPALLRRMHCVVELPSTQST